MGMITSKKLIAVLLIPIMLIVFATPAFALDSLIPTNVGSTEITQIAQKVLKVALNVGKYSANVGMSFASQFMGINGLSDIMGMVPRFIYCRYECGRTTYGHSY